MKLSLITVSYNSKKTIQRTFNSIKMQDYKNIEYIVIDGGSTDGTIDIIKKNSNLINKWISEPDNGIYDAMNKGINISTGEVIGLINSDDFYNFQDSISLIMNAFKEKNADVVFANTYYVSSKNTKKIVRKWRPGKFIKGSYKNGWHTPHPSFFAKKNLYSKYGNFDCNLTIAADFDLMLRFMETTNSKSNYLDKFITSMTLGGASNSSLKNIIRGNKDVIKAFSKYDINISPLYPILRLVPKIKQYFS